MLIYAIAYTSAISMKLLKSIITTLELLLQVLTFLKACICELFSNGRVIRPIICETFILRV